MPSRYLMQVVDRETREAVSFEPGRQVERDFVDSVVAKVVRKGVGIGRTSAKVEQAVRQGIEEAIFELKAMVTPV